MEYNTRTESGYRVLELSGEVDLHYSPQARKQILSLLKEGYDLLVDLSAVEYIDSSGVASLVEGYQSARDDNLRFGLIGVSDAAMQVLQLARLDKVFPIYNSIEDL
ncbi:MAG: STAS domain-containing protein [Gammaproteobacteria bacterium]|nr:STAS domain-containing protein [Gammaproteobacteria bacterium]